MKYVFVGDIHGKVDMVEKALAKAGKKIFVGDFIDSFDRSLSDHSRCYHLVIEAIKAGEAEAIWGNHELSYSHPNRHRCSGFNRDRQKLMMQYQVELNHLFKPYLLIDGSDSGVLVSHAGLTSYIWEEYALGHKNLQMVLDDWWEDSTSPMHWIGRVRGGDDNCGGMFWCDFNHEFTPVPNLTQVFGHTRGKGIRTRGNNFCIDTLDFEESFLEMDL